MTVRISFHLEEEVNGIVLCAMLSLPVTTRYPESGGTDAIVRLDRPRDYERKEEIVAKIGKFDGVSAIKVTESSDSDF